MFGGDFITEQQLLVIISCYLFVVKAHRLKLYTLFLLFAKENNPDLIIERENKTGAGGHTANVPSGFRMRCISVKTRVNDNMGAGITPNKTTVSKLYQS